MSRNAIMIAIACLAAGLLAGAWWPDAPGATRATVREDAAIAARLESLEQALDTEREARQLLEDELFRLMSELDAAPPGTPGRQAAIAGEPARPADPVDEPQPRRVRRAGDSSAERVESLLSAGFSEDRAELIARREAELRMQAMQARFEARQQGERLDFASSQFSADQALREELGEADYERYLEASGRPTSIAVNSVLQFSPAEQVGLRPGDQILRYNGERVYSVFDLNRSQGAVAPDASVVVDVLRDGQPMQLTMPAGPLGITAGRGRSFRNRSE